MRKPAAVARKLVNIRLLALELETSQHSIRKITAVMTQYPEARLIRYCPKIGRKTSGESESDRPSFSSSGSGTGFSSKDWNSEMGRSLRGRINPEKTMATKVNNPRIT